MSSQGDVKQDACNKCNKKVFQPEKIIADDRLFHQSCFKCETCNIQLSTTNYSGSEGTYYCFKDFKAAQKEQNSQSDSKDSQIEDKICPPCKQVVCIENGIVLDNEDLVHRSCFVCSECKTPLQLGNYQRAEQNFFCSRHQFQSNTPENGRKKARGFISGSLDADPLQGSLQDLEIQESKKNDKKEIIEEKKETEEEPGKTHEGDVTTDSKNEASEDATKDRSVSQSETDFIDITDEEDHEKQESGVFDSEKSDGSASATKMEITKTPSQSTMELGDDASESQATSKRPRKTPRKKIKKKKKSERSEMEDTEDKSEQPKSKRRREKTRKLKKAPSTVDVEVEDSKEDKEKKKKGKRGLFSLKKKSRGSSTSSVKKLVSDESSNSLTSFVSSRFRKTKRDSTPEVPTNKSPQKPSPVQRQHKYSKPEPETESGESDNEQLEALDDLAPLGGSEKKNRLSRLKRNDSKDTHSSSPPKEENIQKPVKVKPVSLDLPIPFQTLNSLTSCANTLEEDIPLDELNIPEQPSTQKELSWSSYELSRKLPPLELNIPDEIIPPPADVKERILQSGFFVPTIVKFGLIGVQRRTLDFLSILTTTYPFEIQVVGGTDLSSKAAQILQERYGDSFKHITSPTELLSQDIDWVFLGSTYNNIADNILLSLNSGKNVFCEKPVCFSVADCLKIREAHSKSGKKFYGGFVWRLVPFYQELYDLLRSEVLGKIVSVEMNNLLSPAEAGRLMSIWSNNRKYCCTPLFDTFCFEIDILNWLLDCVPTKVGSFSGLNVYVPSNKPKTDEEMEPYLDWTCKPVVDNLPTDPFTAQKDIDDNHVIIMQYRNHVRASCHINTNAAFPQRRILICGINGTLEGDLYTGKINYKKISEQYETNVIQVTPGMAHGGGDQQLMEDLMDSSLNKPANCFDGEEIFPSVITVLGIEQSKQTGSIIDLEPQWKNLGI